MTNHIHMIVNCNKPFQLKDTIRDFKKFTAKQIISESKNDSESRKEWWLAIFEKAGSNDPKNKTYKVWRNGNHAIELYSEKFTWGKVTYIRQNPVRLGAAASILCAYANLLKPQLQLLVLGHVYVPYQNLQFQARG